MKPIIFMFSGQGSHYYQMAQALYEENTIFRHWMRKGDAIYQDLVGLPLIEELYNPQRKKSDPFTRTLFTHPAIFIVEHALAQVLLSQGLTPDYVLGSSLGEFSAAVVAGIFSFEEGLKDVVTQAQMLETYCGPGAMLAIIQPQKFYEDHSFIKDKSELAAINFSSHFVISGHTNSLEQISTVLKEEQQVSFQKLAVAQGFHSSLIDAAASPYLQFLDKCSFRSPCLPFVSCTHRGSLKEISSPHFWEVIRAPLLFQATIEALEKENSFIYIDLGPSGTLATFAKYNLKETSCSQTFAILTPFGSDLNNLSTLFAGFSL